MKKLGLDGGVRRRGKDKLNKRRSGSRSTSKSKVPSKRAVEKSPDGILKMLLHDIQNHLQAIRMEIDLLDIESNHHLDFSRIVHAIDRASLSLQDVGDYYSIQELCFSMESVESILEDVISEFHSAFQEHGVKLQVLTGQPLPLVLIDADKFRSVLQRIVEFCRTLLQHGGGLEIEGLARRDHGIQKVELRFSISSLEPFEFDGGDLFSPFLRVNGHKIGLGMALAKEILKHLHGQLSFDKTLSKRATIMITLESSEISEQD